MIVDATGILARLVGQRCWQARRGHGAFLTFDFGTPIENGRFGEWHLWVYLGDWWIGRNTEVLASYESPRAEIDGAVATIERAQLAAVEIDETNGATTFRFEGDRVLRVAPCSWDDDPEVEWWLLYTPDETVLDVRAGPTWTYLPITAERGTSGA